MKTRKGIVLAGGSGTRLYPLTIGVSKQLLPVYDKPMIYYPISVLMLAGIREILIITTREDENQFKRLLGDGSQWAVELQYKVQPKPDGLAQSFILAKDFLDGAPSVLILGDNIFFGHGLPELLNSAGMQQAGATVFGYHVNDPERYGVVGFDSNGNVASITEKPDTPASNFAVTGIYFVDETAPLRALQLKPSMRGELEITSLLESYLKEEKLTLKRMGRGYAWLDTGTQGSLLNASNYVRTLVERQGLQVGSPDEIAYQLNWISKEQITRTAKLMEKSDYGQYLLGLKEFISA